MRSVSEMPQGSITVKVCACGGNAYECIGCDCHGLDLSWEYSVVGGLHVIVSVRFGGRRWGWLLTEGVWDFGS